MSSRVVRLAADTPARRERLGGKACGLVRLLAAGLPVPPAWCVPADLPLDAELEDELSALWASWVARDPMTRLAVRSSSPDEDGETASGAGVFPTVLGVHGASALHAAVRSVRAGADTAAARAYRRARGLGAAGPMAVIVQHLVRADVAGVLHTANPLRPFAREYVVDAAWGLGEGVVSGRVDPDRFILDPAGHVRGFHLGAKGHAVRLGDGGPEAHRVPAADGARACLTADELCRLAELGRRVDAHVGARADLEWALAGGRLHVLQHRPIVGLPPATPRVVCSRRFGDEYLAGYVLPLGRTFLVRWIRDVTFHDFARRIGRRDLLAVEPLEHHEGYAYVRSDYVLSLARGIPRAARHGPPAAWFPASFRPRLAAEPFDPLACARWALAPWLEPGASLLENPRALAAHCASIEAEIAPRLREELGALSTDRWERELDRVDTLGRDHFRVIRWGMAHHGPLLHALLERWLASWAGDADGSLYHAVVAGLGGTRTAEVNRDLWHLGRLARDHGEASEPFSEALERFLARHGHRSCSREISEPRWREAPDLVRALARTHAAGGDLAPDPESRAREAAARRDAAERRILERARDPLRRGLMLRLARLAREYTRYREDQRYYLDYVLCHCRRLVLEMGRRLVAAGALAEANDVFLLEIGELRSLARAPRRDAALAATIEARRAHWLRHRDRLPATFLYDGVETEGEGEPGETSGAPEGTERYVGVSQGRARGPARIVVDVSALATVRPGDVLVAPTLDPAWTSALAVVSGLVTETGGTLSHGAVLAREYGVPAVAGVPGATRRFANGELLELDGGRGTLRAVSAAGGVPGGG
ncbi:MAG: phosphoenolpyruvate synthase [Polyangiaceae bacterium]|nr:phosphoenolpyruvate synthase [Polyangiaceae bacterium]